MSSKLNKAQHRKLLVRNTSTNPSKTSITAKKSDHTKTKSETTVTTKKSTLPSESSTNTKLTQNFDLPELNTALQLAKKIRNIENVKPKKPKDSLTAESNNLYTDEKVTRLVNFPYDQQIYKDLIPICVKGSAPTVLTSRPPMPQRDREPVLSDYCEPRKCKEYTYTPKGQCDREQLLPITSNNLRLYKILQLAHEQTMRYFEL